MIQGTGSHVGKSVLVTALCRLFHRKGLRVAPFKAQNMALNSFVTADGMEIGWAQAVQAQAAGLLPHADFNPVLLKPTGEKKSQVIVQGKPMATLSAMRYERLKPKLWPEIEKALDRLREEFDLVIIEGAGSPAEINLKKNDIVNMRVARYAQSPVLLVSDIDRGGVFASLLGTLALLEPWEKKLVRGMVINKFRGDEKILRPGVQALARKARKPVLGVLPYFDFEYQDQEDSMALDEEAHTASAPSSKPYSNGKIRVAVVRTPRISNFTDFDSLRREQCVSLTFARGPEQLNDPDLIILPGSKNTLEDLAYLKSSGLAQEIVRAAGQGAHVLGICAGYQMLGRALMDPECVESSHGSMAGLELLDTQTTFYADKSLHQVEFRIPGAAEIWRGYEIHMGRTKSNGRSKPLFHIVKRSGHSVQDTEGTVNTAGNVMGTYVHGLLSNDGFRHGLLKDIAKRKGLSIPSSHLLKNYEAARRKDWDKLADWAEENLDMAAIYNMAGLNRKGLR